MAGGDYTAGGYADLRGSAAKFRCPTGVKLYRNLAIVADTGNQAVRQIVLYGVPTMAPSSVPTPTANNTFHAKGIHSLCYAGISPIKLYITLALM